MAKMTDEERKVAKTLVSPIRWGQAYLKNRDGNPRSYWPHQVQDLVLCQKSTGPES